jgi:hypothetical protein
MQKQTQTRLRLRHISTDAKDSGSTSDRHRVWKGIARSIRVRKGSRLTLGHPDDLENNQGIKPNPITPQAITKRYHAFISNTFSMVCTVRPTLGISGSRHFGDPLDAFVRRRSAAAPSCIAHISAVGYQ